MSLSINTDIQALNSQYFFYKSNNILEKSLRRIGSGLRINIAADDASGLMIADSLKSKHTSIGQAVANANDGINIVQIADGALEESINIVNTIRTKSIQAASDGQNLSSRKVIQSDINKLIEELEAIADTTVFNGQNLLDGTYQNKTFHIGAGKDETIKINIGNAKASKIGAIAYAKTNRDTQAAVSNPFLEGDKVTAEALSEGDILINGVEIGETHDHYLYYDDTSYSQVTKDSAMAKAQGINEKINQTGVQAKAITEAVIGINATIDTAQINGISITGSPTNATQFVDSVNNNKSLQNMGIKAENIGTDGLVRIIADDGRNLTINGDVDMTLNGVAMTANNYTFNGNITLSNARAMKAGNVSISKGTINSGDLIINGVDIASGGALGIKDYDSDRTLVNAINRNQVLQQIGIRAELYCSNELETVSKTIPEGIKAGDLDTTFDTDGKVITTITNGADSGNKVLIQPDGKIIVAGYSDDGSGNNDFALVRYNDKGVLDPSFGTGGIVTVPPTLKWPDNRNKNGGYSAALQSDGKIIVVGEIHGDFAILRYDTNGNPDNTFNGNGINSTNIGSENDVATAVTIQPDGKIIVGGTCDNSSKDIALVRYNSDGSQDFTFGFGIPKDITGGDDIIKSIAFQADGKIIVAGEFNNNFGVLRFNSDGSPDNTFGDGTSGPGVVLTPFGGQQEGASDLVIQSDGKIVVGGYSRINGTEYVFAAARYNSDGSLDTTFDTDGMLTTQIGSTTNGSKGYSIALQPDGKIIFSGTTDCGTLFNDLAIVKYNTDGSLDSDFGTNGIMTTQIGNDINNSSVAIQSDGKIVIGGTTKKLAALDFFAARYLNTITTTNQINDKVYIRLISDNQPITISGNNPYGIAGLTAGETEGIKTTGIILDTANTSDMTHDDMLRKLGFDGSLYGTKETNGANNQANNDIAVINSSYLSSSPVTDEALSDGDININNIKIGVSSDNTLYYGTNTYTIANTTAMSKSQAINDKINQTGVQAKAVTKVEVGINGTINTATINGISVAGNPANATAFANSINNDGNFQRMGIKAEIIGNNNIVRIIADDGRDLVIHGDVDMTLNNVAMTASDYTFKGNMIFSNAQAMVNGHGQIKAGYLNSGDLVINGIALPPSGSLIVQIDDNDNALVNGINGNEELQKMGIRAEKYNSDGGGVRIRVISERDSITISGTDPSKIARLISGTVKGIKSTEIKIKGSQTDNTPMDNFLRKIGLSGAKYGTTEENGVDNSSGNDILYFGRDRMQYDTGDVAINGYNLGKPKDDGISDIYADKSAKAWSDAVNLIKNETGIEADIIKAMQKGVGEVKEGILQQKDFMINGIDIIRDNTGGNGMKILKGDADNSLIDAINEYREQTGVTASKDSEGRLILSAIDGRNIHVQSSSNGNKHVKFEADFRDNGIAQDSVYFGNIRLVSDKTFKIKGAGSSGSEREISLLKIGLSGGGSNTEATSDLKSDGEITAGLNYKTAIKHLSLITQEGAEMAIRTADVALNNLENIRSDLGSTQNQLTSTISNLSATRINLISSESTIRDVNFAEESSIFSKTQILLQAGSYALAQCNTSSQSIMRLLQ
ncbi:MAG: hypothetical protein HQK78_11300 [Desulfobacterales bacterium]|nr:hypothetical protein [Desulfobacterales bacterium]